MAAITGRQALRPMPASKAKIENRAVKAAKKASKKRGHVLTGDELLSLRVQTMAAPLRIVLVLAGILSAAACWTGWPTGSFEIRALEGLAGFFLILFGIFGIRRTLSNVLDTIDLADAATFAGRVLDKVVDALPDLDVF